MRKEYVKPTINPGGDNFVFAAMRKQIEIYKKTGLINGKRPPEKAAIACRQCSACHGCR